jgi:hypothetical protein
MMSSGNGWLQKSVVAASDQNPATLRSIKLVTKCLLERNVKRRVTVKAAKELHFNKDGSAIKRMQVRAGSHC